ncbi:hypothetical protein R1flu_024683 [Riccia fluitans]|uniref:Uncharacterized protein n=1 Tax=Riccia fluitans TaxID=41844 RepID=A0ABD1XYK3_9MARC
MGLLCLSSPVVASSLSASVFLSGGPKCHSLRQAYVGSLKPTQRRSMSSVRAHFVEETAVISSGKMEFKVLVSRGGNKFISRRRVSCYGKQPPSTEPEPHDPDYPKEEAVLYRRTSYEHKDWTRHRSSLRHSRHIFSMISSRVILALWPPVFGLTAVAAVLSAYNEALSDHWLPSFLPLLHVSSVPFQLVCPALALLLVFRTNASYARFDEARKAWGSNVNRTRDFTRQALTWMQHPSDAEKVRKIIRLCVAFNFCLKHHLVREGDLREELYCLIEKDEVDGILASCHKPNYVLLLMSELINSCTLTDMQLARMDENLTQFADNLGACERIFKTPIPLSYTRLTSRFLVFWHIALPLALWDHCHWLSVPATFLSAGALFCIEEVGVLIEEPFQIFPLDNICCGIKKAVDNLMVAHAEIHSCYKLLLKGPPDRREEGKKGRIGEGNSKSSLS